MNVSLRRVAEAESTLTEMYLLYVGRPSEAVKGVLDQARQEGWFDRVVPVECDADGFSAAAARAVQEHGLRAGQHTEGLVILWDLDFLEETSASGSESGRERVLRIGDALRRPSAADWSPDHVAFGLTSRGTEVSFVELTDFLCHDVAGIGDVSGARESLRAWSRPFPEGGGFGLRGAFSKAASVWLSELRHDYLNNGLLAESVRSELSRADLGSRHAELDFWQHHLRNLLLSPRRYGRYRVSPSEVLGEPELDRRYDALELRVLVPRWLTGEVDEDGGGSRWFEFYRSADEARARAESLGKTGVGVVVLWDVDIDPEPPRIPGLPGGAASAPIVLIGRDEPPRLEWRRWQELLARNVLGGFSERELLAPYDPDPEGARRLDRLVAHWRAFCLASPLSAMTGMRDLVAETWEQIGVRLPEKKRKLIYRTVAALEVARVRHFGPHSADA